LLPEVKLLLDQNISRKMAPRLQAHFPGTTHVFTIGLELAHDLAVWEYAKDNRFLIVTHDSDFYDLALSRGCPPKIVWLRCGNQPAAAIEALLAVNSDAIQAFALDEELICLELY
jgi:predicted nuclease of predicted toxin-antitoxin system